MEFVTLKDEGLELDEEGKHRRATQTVRYRGPKYKQEKIVFMKTESKKVRIV